MYKDSRMYKTSINLGKKLYPDHPYDAGLYARAYRNGWSAGSKSEKAKQRKYTKRIRGWLSNFVDEFVAGFNA